jgi:hypothetical protein
VGRGDREIIRDSIQDVLKESIQPRGLFLIMGRKKDIKKEEEEEEEEVAKRFQYKEEVKREKAKGGRDGKWGRRGRRGGKRTNKRERENTELGPSVSSLTLPLSLFFMKSTK